MRIINKISSPGNIFVIAAIVLERNLQCVANYLILSLAVADLLVAVLVMPLGAVYQVRLSFIFTISKQRPSVHEGGLYWPFYYNFSSKLFRM